MKWLNQIKDNKQVNLITIAKVSTLINTYKIFQVKNLLDYAEANNLHITDQKIIEFVSPEYKSRKTGTNLKKKAKEVFSNQFLMSLEQ